MARPVILAVAAVTALMAALFGFAKAGIIPWHTVTPVILAFASVIAIAAIISQRDLEKKRDSIAVMMDTREDDRLREASEILAKIDRDDDDSIEIYAAAKPGDREKWRSRSAVIKLLNFYEAVSVGIINRIYDEQIIYDRYHTDFLLTEKRTRRFVGKLREVEKLLSLYQNFQEVARRFEVRQKESG